MPHLDERRLNNKDDDDADDDDVEDDDADDYDYDHGHGDSHYRDYYLTPCFNRPDSV